MKIRFCTDFHLGATLRQHTNSKSQQRLREKLYESALDIVTGQEAVVMLGDLFDKHSNKEDIVLQGITVASQCTYVLAGNHDQINIDGSVGSLTLVAETSNGVVLNPHPGKGFVDNRSLGGTGITFIPHCYTQELFEKSIRAALKVASKRDILCLHCNVGTGHGHEIESEGSSLYLTPELEKLVCDAFEYVLVGHEHVGYQRKNLIVLGNHFPVSFGEIADRFVYEFDTKTRKFAKIKVFDAAAEFETITVEEFMSAEGDMESACSFVEVAGEILPEDAAKLHRYLLKFWRNNEESLLAVRNSVVTHQADRVKKKVKIESLRDTLEREAAAAGFMEELEELRTELQG